MLRSRKRKVAVFMMGCVALFSLGCNARTGVSETTTTLSTKAPAIGTARNLGSPKNLDLVGYNYTNRYIHQFSVNGNGGSNLFLSGPQTGGGKTTCCVAYSPSQQKTIVDVQWQSGDCTYTTKSSISDDVFENLHNYYRTAKVELDTTGAGHDPKYVEIHFFPDGSVKGYVTNKESAPMLSLSEDREDRSEPPRCPNDKKPE